MSKEERKIKKSETVTVFGTGASKFLPENQESGKIHKVQAEKLVAAGKASWKPRSAKAPKQETANA